jgi:hypothetical protein
MSCLVSVSARILQQLVMVGLVRIRTAAVARTQLQGPAQPSSEVSVRRTEGPARTQSLMAWDGIARAETEQEPAEGGQERRTGQAATATATGEPAEDKTPRMHW